MLINQIIKKILRNFNLTTTKKINSVAFKLPLLNAIGALNILPHEKWMIQLFELLLKSEPNSIFLDVGVNVGQTLLKIKSIKKEIEYYGFEPNSACNYYLQALIKANKLSNCHLFPVGLGEKINVGEFYIFDDDISSASGTTISDLLDKRPAYIDYIPVFPLDFFKERFFKGKVVNLLKIDVENGELEVLKGAMETIKDYSPFIITEILPIVNKATVEKTNARKLEMQKLMNSTNYLFFKIVINKDDEFVGLRLAEDIVTGSLESNDHRGDWNYLIVPQTKITVINNFTLQD
jgi:FkbM family methyltransferase